VLEIIHGRRLIDSLMGPHLLDDSVVDDRTRHHALGARMDGWWTVAAGILTPRGSPPRTGPTDLEPANPINLTRLLRVARKRRKKA